MPDYRITYDDVSRYDEYIYNTLWACPTLCDKTYVTPSVDGFPNESFSIKLFCEVPRITNDNAEIDKLFWELYLTMYVENFSFSANILLHLL